MNSLHLQRVTVVEYRLPGKSTQASAGDAAANYLIRVAGLAGDVPVVGLGECQPRGRSTGDEPVASWQYLQHAGERLEGLSIPFAGSEDATKVIEGVLDDLDHGPREETGSAAARFRGTRLGIEIALLDITARARGVGLSDLLGRHRSEIEVVTPAISLSQSASSVAHRYRAQLRLTHVFRFELSGDVDGDLRLLRSLARQHSPADSNHTWWIEARAGLTPSDAENLVSDLVKDMRRGRLPAHVILEQPVGASRRSELAALQRRADRLSAKGRRGHLDLRVMADESLRTAEDLASLTEDGGCRAVNLKSARVGGLLPSLALAEAATRQHADTTVALSGMASTSDLSFRAMLHLGLSLPRLDYFTRAPATAGTKITNGETSFLPHSRRLGTPVARGLGVDLTFSALIDHTGRYRHFPDHARPKMDGKRARGYPDERHTRFLTKTAMRSHLVEREALAHGMATLRFSTVAFIARPNGGPPLAFGASARAPVSSACSFMISDQHKGAAQALLMRAGLPVPEGRVFAQSDLESAVRYAEAIGYPVVTKPVSGTGGAGVSTNIADADELAAGFAAVRETRFSQDDIVVQRHIPGDVYRIVVHDHEVTAALLRVPPSVTGDGVRSIAELVVEKNSYRRDNPRLRKGLIRAERASEYLRTTGRDLDEVPDLDSSVSLARDAYLNLGGESVDVLEELHPSIADMAVRAVAAIPGLRFCGLDILLTDHRRSVTDQPVGICELNACPELITPQFPLFGEPRLISRRLLAMAAAKYGVGLPDRPADELSCRIRVSGTLGPNYVDWVARRARDLSLQGWVAATDANLVEVVAVGGLVPISTLASIAISGPPGTTPQTVETSHVEKVESASFEVRSGPLRRLVESRSRKG